MPRISVPRICRHKPSGRAYVRLNSATHYLGRWGSRAAQTAYRQLIINWEANGRQPAVAPDEITIGEICTLYLTHLIEYFGRGSKSIDHARIAIKALRKNYELIPAAKFGPRTLKAVQQEMVAAGATRSGINRATREIRRMFKWAVSDELIDESIYRALTTMEGLRRGHTPAPETAPILPVLDEHVEAIREYVASPVWAMICLQQLTAARPGEIVGLRATDFDRSGEVWTHTPPEHKMANAGRERILYFGARAQKIINKFTATRPLGAYLFSPREANAERHAGKSSRRPDQKPNGRITSRVMGEKYTVASYRNAIARACRAAHTRHWTPNQLRHAAATKIRTEFGVEYAQVILGHSDVRVTQIYAEVDRQKAILVAQKMG